FAARERALQPSSLTLEGLRNFWSRERRADGRLLHLEKQMLARAVLGIAPATTPEEDWFAQHLADLPARRRDIVRAIAADYQDLIELVRATSHGFLTTEDRQVIVFL